MIQNLPAKTGMAFIIVQHLSPDFKSLMGQLISQHTEMKVTTARNNTILRPDHVYLIPRKKDMRVEGDKLTLTDKDPDQKLNLPIDKFFHSLGQEQSEKAIAVVLSGTGTDGSRGIMTVKERGGLVLVQDPRDAKFDGMPNAAIQTKTADAVLSAEAIGKHLTRIAKSGVRIELEADEMTPQAILIADIVTMIRKQTGMDFTHYKRPTILRRLEKMMTFEGFDTLEDYATFLRANPEQVTRLRDEFLIGVTHFFRDDAPWKYLQSKVIPELAANANGKDLRIWTVGCSTGEEAYSMAILLEEERRRTTRNFDYKIFATDVDAAAVAKAGSGQFLDSIVADIPEIYLTRYFEQSAGGYRVVKFLRERIVFAAHNVIADPPFIRMDLISCRNLMIYIKADIQRKLMINFQFALNYGGVLMLGMSESVGDLKHALVPLDEKLRVYQNRLKTKISSPEVLDNTPRRPGAGADLTNSPTKTPASTMQRQAVDQFLMKTYVPLVLVLAQSMDVLYIKGDFRFLLQFPQDGGDFNLENMLDAKLIQLIKSGMRATLRKREHVLMKQVDLGLDSEAKYDLLFRELPDQSLAQQSVIVEFHNEQAPPVEAVVIEGASSKSFSDEQMHVLEGQLRTVREERAQALEELETSNEELQSSNEELLAANEELQSTNEELQSVNEELFTVNTELQERIHQMTVLNDDWENLFRTTDVGTIFLDKELRIRRFTPAIAPLFKLELSDRGRSLDSFKANFAPANYLDHVAKSLEELTPVELQVEHLDSGRSYVMRGVPYRTSDDQIDGVVVTFNDVTALTKAKRYYQQLFENSEEILTVFDAKGNVIDQNRAPEGVDLDMVMGDGWKKIYPKQTVAFVERRLKEVVSRAERLDYELSTTHPDGTESHYKTTMTPLELDNGKERILSTGSDVSAIRNREKEAKERERFISGITETAPLLIYVYDLKKQSNVFVNREMYREVGYSVEEFRALSNGILDILHQEDLPAVAAHQKSLAEDKKDHIHYVEYRIRDKTGRDRWFGSWDRAYKRNQAGEVTQYIGAAQDITTEKEASLHLNRALVELQDRRHELEISNQELEQFAYIASHDLQEPIRTVSQYLQLLEMQAADALGSEEMGLVGSAIRASNRMRDLIYGLLEVSKVSSAEVAFEDTNVQEVFANISEVMQNRLLETGGTFTHDKDVSEIKCDPVLFEQLVTNLVSNGLKFQKPDVNPEVYLGYKREENEHHFWVQDNGIGIPEDQQGRVFQLFQRGHVREDYAGHGIGLTICKRIVERHRGTIWIESHAGRGTAVHFRIPIKLKNTTSLETPLAH